MSARKCSSMKISTLVFNTALALKKKSTSHIIEPESIGGGKT
jgi:hypothetical protein